MDTQCEISWFVLCSPYILYLLSLLVCVTSQRLFMDFDMFDDINVHNSVILVLVYFFVLVFVLVLPVIF